MAAKSVEPDFLFHNKIWYNVLFNPALVELKHPLGPLQVRLWSKFFTLSIKRERTPFYDKTAKIHSQNSCKKPYCFIVPCRKLSDKKFFVKKLQLLKARHLLMVTGNALFIMLSWGVPTNDMERSFHPVYCCAHDTAGIASSFSAGVEAFDAVGFPILSPGNPNGA